MDSCAIKIPYSCGFAHFIIVYVSHLYRLGNYSRYTLMKFYNCNNGLKKF